MIWKGQPVLAWERGWRRIRLCSHCGRFGVEYQISCWKEERQETNISWPASLTLAICFGKDSSKCAGTNHVALMQYLSHNFRSLSTPTVAPNMPRDTSVGSAAKPSLVLILIESQFEGLLISGFSIPTIRSRRLRRPHSRRKHVSSPSLISLHAE